MKYGMQYLGMQYLRVEETYSACDTNYVNKDKITR